MTSTTITPIEIDGQFYVSVILDGHEKRYGPYSDTEAAETMAARFAGICRGVFHQQVAIGVVRHTSTVQGKNCSAGPFCHRIACLG